MFNVTVYSAVVAHGNGEYVVDGLNMFDKNI